MPGSVLWVKPGRAKDGSDASIRMQKDYRVVPRGIALVIGCNTFPTWNGYPGLFASLVTGNPVIVKPHPRAVLPLAISVDAARSVLRDAGFDPALVQRPRRPMARPWPRRSPSATRCASSTTPAVPASAPGSRRTAPPAGRLVYTEKAGVNTVVVDSTDNLRGALGNLAFSLTLYSGQMCTTPQNIYVPREGIDTDEGHLSFEEFGARLGAAVSKLTGDDARAVELLGATVNEGVRANARGLAALAEEAGGTVVLDSRSVSHPAYPTRWCRRPGWSRSTPAARTSTPRSASAP